MLALSFGLTHQLCYAISYKIILLNTVDTP